jgi:hypothetical protein
VSRFVRNIDFSSLGVRDLLEARELYHVHLANLENVVGTAIGRYRIRYTDLDYQRPEAGVQAQDNEPRSLDNSGVRPWSWPCVIVFVREWATREELGRKPAQFVPPRLYLPDGRVVPTCVVLARPQPLAPPLLQDLNFPSDLVGGGYPILTEDQGQQRVGSIGCLVTDGAYAYALTSEHVVGDEGTPAYVLERGERKIVAYSHARAAARIAWEDAYPGLPGLRTLVNVDAGLFKVTELGDWTAQIYGVGRMGELIDLNVDTLTLDLIECPVAAFGGASGQLRGKVDALFYRYRTVGGFDYIAELLIGPRRGDRSVTTRPGDSGTVWFWDARADQVVPFEAAPAALPAEQTATAPHEPEPILTVPEPTPGERVPELRPLALQWGGHSFLEPGGQGVVQFALASSLATVCRALDVELIRDWEIGHSQYWGKVGHYKIALTACLLAFENANVAQLMQANATRVSVDDTALKMGQLPMMGSDSFIALADVADLVWRTTRKRDAANHFADMDEPGGANVGGKTLLELWRTPANRTPAKWTAFYDSLPGTPRPNRHRGALPFRVRELYEAMVEFVRKGQVPEFICAAGVLAHYVGDACQPLHVSHLHHGEPGHPEQEKVHSVYETKMLDRFAPEVVERINAATEDLQVTNIVTGGAAAANRVVQLMKKTIETLSPQTVVETFVEVAGRNQTKKMWEALGGRTITCMAGGALCLAELWQSAWIEGDGDNTVDSTVLGDAVSRQTLRSLYNDPTFVESRWLRDMSFDS